MSTMAEGPTAAVVRAVAADAALWKALEGPAVQRQIARTGEAALGKLAGGAGGEGRELKPHQARATTLAIGAPGAAILVHIRTGGGKTLLPILPLGACE